MDRNPKELIKQVSPEELKVIATFFYMKGWRAHDQTKLADHCGISIDGAERLCTLLAMHRE